MAKRLSRQPLLFQLFVRFRENKPTKDYSCKISDQNSKSKCHLYIDYEMVALKPPPPFYLKNLKITQSHETIYNTTKSMLNFPLKDLAVHYQLNRYYQIHIRWFFLANYPHFQMDF